MTKREHFAAVIMQGLVAHHGYGESHFGIGQEMARWAVQLADHLVDELNRQGQPEADPVSSNHRTRE